MKKITRKDIAKMSTRQVLAAARAPYRRLASYLKPYKGRFLAGILFGLLAGATNMALIQSTRFVADTVLAKDGEVEETNRGIPMPDWVTKTSKSIKNKLKKKPVAAPATILAMFQGPPLKAASKEAIDARHSLALERSRAAGETNPGDRLDDSWSGWVEVMKLPTEPYRPHGTLSRVLMLCGLIPLIMGIRGLAGYLNAYCMQWVSIRVLDDIRQEVFEKVLAQSQEFFNKQKTGDLIQTIFNQTRMAQMALTQISSDVVKQPAALAGALLAMLMIDWKFTLLSFTVFPLCLVPVLIIGKKVRQSSNKEEEEAGVLMNVMHEALGGIRVVKSLSREEYEAKRFSVANQQMLRLMMRWRKAMELAGPLVETTASLGIAGALVYAWHAGLSSGEFIGLSGSLVLMYDPAKTLGKLHILMQKCLASTTKIFELMDLVPTVTDAPEADKLPKSKGYIEFRDVTFAYSPKSPAPTISGITFTVPQGTTLALVGQTGSGKSTIVSLLLRFYDPKSGQILVDGHDVRSVTQKSLRDQIAFVNQEVFLFHDTIYENIRYGRLDATQEEVEEAARRAHAHEFILAQNEGYQTVVGDRGCNLSGGQRQRLCIARAFLRNAPILLLDEATSALDSETEANIQADLDELAKNRTVIAIAHRLSTILRAEQIVVMHEGLITAVGPHHELLQTSEIYQRLYRMQFEHGMESAGAGI